MQIDCSMVGQLVDSQMVDIDGVLHEILRYVNPNGFAYRAIDPVVSMCYTTIEEVINEISSPVGTYILSVQSHAVTDGVSQNVVTSFVINGVTRQTPYSANLEAGKYSFFFPLQITVNNIIHNLEGSSQFTVYHPVGADTRIDAVYSATTTPPSNGGTAPVTRSLRLAENKILEGRSFTFNTSKTVSPITPGDLSKLIEARLDYTVTFLEGADNVKAWMVWNEETIDEIPFGAMEIGKTVTKSVDFLDRVRSTNTLQYGFDHRFFIGAGAGKMLFDIWLVLGFSSTPDVEPTVTEPTQPFEIPTTLLIGGAVVAGLLLLRGGGPSITIVQPKNS